MVEPIEEAAIKVPECDIEELTKESYDLYELAVFSAYGMEYAVGTDEESQAAAEEAIKNSAWSFRPEFIASHTKAGATNGMIKAITALQETCEDCNDDILSLIEDIEDFVEDAISADGRGTFLATYDSDEIEIKVNGIDYYCYRLA